MSSKREFDNPLPFQSYVFPGMQKGKAGEEFLSKIKQWIEKNLVLIKDNLTNERDCSIYTGCTGIVYLLNFLANGVYKGTPKEPELTDLAYSVCQSSYSHLTGKRITFLCGDAGPLCLGAVLTSRKGDLRRMDENISKLKSFADRCCHDDSMPNEVLYGRAGYLFALIFLQQNISPDCIDDSLLLKVCDAILKHGRDLARKDRAEMPLKFIWHEKEYLGAAHGYIGIFYILLQPQLLKHKLIQDALPEIKQCIDHLASMRFPSGNFPSSVGNHNDKLIQWCHGAPGAAILYSRAYQVFADEKYLTIARECCAVIWQRGLLQKGHGICHGTAGNAYAFLALFNVTKEEKYLHYAYKFGEWCLAYGKHGCRTPDRPMSLFEGLAGTMYFMADLLEPSKARFPAFQL